MGLKALPRGSDWRPWGGGSNGFIRGSKTTKKGFLLLFGLFLVSFIGILVTFCFFLCLALLCQAF